MQKIFEGTVYDIVAKNDGIIFFCREEEDAPVSVKMLTFSDGRMIDVGLTVYAGSKLGNDYHTVVKYCDNYVFDHVIPLPSGRLFLCTEKGQAYLFSPNGELSWSGEIKYRDMAPSGMDFYKNGLWASFKDADILLRFNLNTMRADLRIGGKNSPFPSPEDIFVLEDSAIVCSKNELIKVNLESYAVEPYYSFEENVHRYLRSGKYEFAVLDSGLYVI